MQGPQSSKVTTAVPAFFLAAGCKLRREGRTAHKGQRVITEPKLQTKPTISVALLTDFLHWYT